MIDNEDYGVELARKILREFKNVEVVKGDAYSLASPDNEFDVVLMTDVIEHLTRPELAVSEAARVMAPNGRVLVTTPQWRPDRIFDIYHVKEYTPQELRDLLRISFEEVEMRYSLPKTWSDFYNTPIGWRVLKLAGRAGFNPFLKSSDKPEGFSHAGDLLRKRG